MAEGKLLGANSLPVEERNLWYDCGYWRLGSFTQNYDPARRAETGLATISSGVCFFLGMF